MFGLVIEGLVRVEILNGKSKAEEGKLSNTKTVDQRGRSGRASVEFRLARRRKEGRLTSLEMEC